MVGLQLVYLLPQPRLKEAVCYEAAPRSDSRGSHSDKLEGGASSALDQWVMRIMWVVAHRVRLMFCFALL